MSDPLDDMALRYLLGRTEQGLDPGDPEADGAVSVLGYGEVSVALTVAALPGHVCKRMSGFADAAAVDTYVQLVAAYLAELRSAGVTVIDTQPVPVERMGRAPVVYLVQPQVPAATLGTGLLHDADDHALAAAIRAVLGSVARLAEHTAQRTDGLEVALDGQLSNWSFDGAPGSDPVLIDVGTPFMRRSGGHLIDREFLLAPVPAGIRAYYRRRRLVEAYLNDYFVPRLVGLDLLGNLHKEGAADRIGLGIEVVNDWLATSGVPGPHDPIGAADVDAYYRKDADLLALYLRLRRMDRFLQTRALRRPYDYVLPGHVAR